MEKLKKLIPGPFPKHIQSPPYRARDFDHPRDPYAPQYRGQEEYDFPTSWEALILLLRTYLGGAWTYRTLDGGVGRYIVLMSAVFQIMEEKKKGKDINTHLPFLWKTFHCNRPSKRYPLKTIGEGQMRTHFHLVYMPIVQDILNQLNIYLHQDSSLDFRVNDWKAFSVRLWVTLERAGYRIHKEDILNPKEVQLGDEICKTRIQKKKGERSTNVLRRLHSTAAKRRELPVARKGPPTGKSYQRSRKPESSRQPEEGATE
jgi:hypothetical protein